MKKFLIILSIILTLGLLGAGCKKLPIEDQKQEEIVKKEYSTSTAFEVIKKTSKDMGWQSLAWHDEIDSNYTWAGGGEKWGAAKVGVLSEENITYFHGIDEKKWLERKNQSCKDGVYSGKWVETKFGKTCCQYTASENYKTKEPIDIYTLSAFLDPNWAVCCYVKNDDDKCSKSLKIMNIFYDNLKDAE